MVFVAVLVGRRVEIHPRQSILLEPRELQCISLIPQAAQEIQQEGPREAQTQPKTQPKSSAWCGPAPGRDRKSRHVGMSEMHLRQVLAKQLGDNFNTPAQETRQKGPREAQT